MPGKFLLRLRPRQCQGPKLELELELELPRFRGRFSAWFSSEFSFRGSGHDGMKFDEVAASPATPAEAQHG